MPLLVKVVVPVPPTSDISVEAPVMLMVPVLVQSRCCRRVVLLAALAIVTAPVVVSVEASVP